MLSCPSSRPYLHSRLSGRSSLVPPDGLERMNGVEAWNSNDADSPDQRSLPREHIFRCISNETSENLCVTGARDERDTKRAVQNSDFCHPIIRVVTDATA
jgi:hypothetical protein